MIMEVDHLVLAFEIETVNAQTDMVLHVTDMSGMETGCVNLNFIVTHVLCNVALLCSEQTFHCCLMP